MNYIRLGTRGSPLALWQATETARLLLAAGFAVDIIPIRTTGSNVLRSTNTGRQSAAAASLPAFRRSTATDFCRL